MVGCVIQSVDRLNSSSAAEGLPVRMRYFGDSYDIVKQSLIRWLADFGQWSAHPMFTEAVTAADVAAFESLLNVKVVSTDVLTLDTDRSAYLACGSACGHLFLDPDTGLRMPSTRGVRPPRVPFRWGVAASGRGAASLAHCRLRSECRPWLGEVTLGGQATGAATPRPIRVRIRLPCMLRGRQPGPRSR